MLDASVVQRAGLRIVNTVGMRHRRRIVVSSLWIADRTGMICSGAIPIVGMTPTWYGLVAGDRNDEEVNRFHSR